MTYPPAGGQPPGPGGEPPIQPNPGQPAPQRRLPDGTFPPPSPPMTPPPAPPTPWGPYSGPPGPPSPQPGAWGPPPQPYLTPTTPGLAPSAPVPGQGYPTTGQGYPTPYLTPAAAPPGQGYPPPGRPGSSKWVVIVLIVAIVLVGGGAFGVWKLRQSSPDPTTVATGATTSTTRTPAATRTTPPPTTEPTPAPTTEPTPTPTTEPTPTPTTDPTSPLPAVPFVPGAPYAREREELTDYERQNSGGLHQGDCLAEMPDSLDVPDGVPTVDCAEPHTMQVAGFVDLSEGMPDRSDGIPFETAVAQRCNSLYVSIPIADDFNRGVNANYPDEDEWAAGSRVALCWVPVFDTTWTGSVLDGTAQVVD